MNIVLSPRVRDEADQIEARLDHEHSGYGRKFLLDLDEALSSIRDHPRLAAPCEDGPNHGEYRESFLKRFQYRLIYIVVDDDNIEITTLVHARSRPGAWI